MAGGAGSSAFGGLGGLGGLGLLCGVLPLDPPPLTNTLSIPLGCTRAIQ